MRSGENAREVVSELMFQLSLLNTPLLITFLKNSYCVPLPSPSNTRVKILGTFVTLFQPTIPNLLTPEESFFLIGLNKFSLKISQSTTLILYVIFFHLINIIFTIIDLFNSIIIDAFVPTQESHSTLLYPILEFVYSRALLFFSPSSFSHLANIFV